MFARHAFAVYPNRHPGASGRKPSVVPANPATTTPMPYGATTWMRFVAP